MNREQMITDNLNLVHYVINTKLQKKIHTTGVYDREDLYQVGVEALIKAVDRYDNSKGTFATYACKCIKGSILKYINNNDYGNRCYRYWDNVVDRYLKWRGVDETKTIEAFLENEKVTGKEKIEMQTVLLNNVSYSLERLCELAEDKRDGTNETFNKNLHNLSKAEDVNVDNILSKIDFNRIDIKTVLTQVIKDFKNDNDKKLYEDYLSIISLGEKPNYTKIGEKNGYTGRYAYQNTKRIINRTNNKIKKQLNKEYNIIGDLF